MLEQVIYKEGVFVGYRWFDEKGLEPAFPFGHGLSYTSFRYRDLRVHEGRGRRRRTVAVDITNTGRRAGTEVAQLYLGLPDRGRACRQPPRVLRGFQRLTLRPGKTKTARFQLTAARPALLGPAANDWRVEPGCYRVMVGLLARHPPAGEISRSARAAPRSCAVASGFKRCRRDRAGAACAPVLAPAGAAGHGVVYQQATAAAGCTRAAAWLRVSGPLALIQLEWTRQPPRPRVRDGFLFARFRMRDSAACLTRAGSRCAARTGASRGGRRSSAATRAGSCAPTGCRVPPSRQPRAPLGVAYGWPAGRGWRSRSSAASVWSSATAHASAAAGTSTACACVRATAPRRLPRAPNRPRRPHAGALGARFPPA